MDEKESQGRRNGISRRDFIKGSGLAVGGVAISSTVLGVACSPPPLNIGQPAANTTTTTPPPPKTVTVIQAPEGVVTLNVNGQKVVVTVQPEWSLAFVLREKLGLVALKVGCDRGECGACNILVDGRAHLACTMMAIESEGMAIVTLEGLSNGSNLHPVQKLFLDNSTFQCGYCTPGMMISAVALLNKTPKPTLEQARQAISGNLCYCGDYTRIVNTIAKGI